MKTIASCLIAFCFSAPCSAQKINRGNIHILYTPNQPTNTFIPSKTIGGAVDGHSEGEINQMLTPVNIEAMKSVGQMQLETRDTGCRIVCQQKQLICLMATVCPEEETRMIRRTMTGIPGFQMVILPLSGKAILT